MYIQHTHTHTHEYPNNELCMCIPFQPTLIEIMTEATPSEYHRVFTSGLAKERHQLTRVRKYGPCDRWTTDRKLALIRHLQSLVEEETAGADGSIFRYAGDVLLPEVCVCVYLY